MARRKRSLQEHTAHTEGLSHEGRGIARVDGKTVFIDGALANETVTFRYSKRHGQYDEGELVNIIEASELRIPARCAHFGTCGGCSLQQLPNALQIAHKQQVFLEQLQHIAHLQPLHVLEPLAGPEWAYRHKARLGVRFVPKKDSVLVGFREKNGRYVAEMDRCHVLAAPVGELITPLRQCVASLNAKDRIAQIEVAIGDARCALIFRNLDTLDQHDNDCLLSFAQQHDFDLYLQPGGPDTIYKLWPTHTPERLYYALPAFKLNFAFHPSDFTQVNPQINQRMVQHALSLLAPAADERVLDLFCGLGNFTLPIAQHSQHVTGVEGSDAMVTRASDNAQANQISNVAFYAADLSIPPGAQPWAQNSYDKILLDPPRSGAQAIAHHIQRFAAKRIVYVSCNSATLARDAGILQEKGYSLDSAGIMDMFPHTRHSEAIALFKKH